MKKMIALLLVAIMSVFCLFACSDEEPSGSNNGGIFDLNDDVYNDDDPTNDSPIIPIG